MHKIKEPFFYWLKKDLEQFGKNRNVKIFIFGSSLKEKNFYDIDVGVSGEVTTEELFYLKEQLTESNLPYIVDIINFNQVKNNFKENIFNNEILWIKP